VVEEVSIGVVVVRIGVKETTVEEVVVVPDLDKDRKPILERKIGNEGVLELLKEGALQEESVGDVIRFKCTSYGKPRPTNVYSSGTLS